MRIVLSLFLALFCASAIAQTVGGGVTLGAGVSVGGFGPGAGPGPPPTNGIFFSPIAGHYVSSQNVAITSVPFAGVNVFSTSDGSPASEASILYASPIPVPSNITFNALSVSAPNTVAQQLQRCQTSSCWKTQLAGSATQEAPYKSRFTCPAIAYGTGSGANDGVAGIPTNVNCAFNVANPSLSGNATRFGFETQNIAGAGSQTQVLWANKQAAADNATYQVEDFYMLPGSHFSGIWALEEDMVLWDRTRLLIKSAALQCYLNAGKWQFNGQAGSWNDFGKDQNNIPIVIYKNGVALSAGTQINTGCNVAANGGTISGALTNSQTTFSTSISVPAGTIIHVDNENILVLTSSGSSVTSSKRGYGSTAASHSSGATFSSWIHVQYHASFNPSVTDPTCKDVKTGLATECVYIDYLAINGIQYTFGTTTTQDANGNTITVSILKVPAAALGSGFPARCFNQLQIDTAGTGASTTNPITYDMVYDNVGMSCGGGTPNATGSATYVISASPSYPVVIPGGATAYTSLEQLGGWVADASSSISPNPPTTYTINQSGIPVVMTLDTVGTAGLYTGWMARKGVTVATGLNMVLRATYSFDSVAGIQAWEVGRRRTNSAQVTDNGQTQLVPKAGGVLEFDIVPSSSGGWVDTGCRFPTFVIGTLYTEELYYVNDSSGGLSLKYVELNGTVCPIPDALQNIAGSVQSPPWAINVASMAFQPDAKPSAVPFNATVTLSAWVW